MQVKDVMTRDVACCIEDTSLQQVAQMMIDNDCGAIPVVQNMDNLKPVGIVTDRDITVRAVAEGRNPLSLSAGDIMTKTVVVARPEESMKELLRTMENNQIRRVVVVDDQEKCVGIVAQADVALQGSDEETGEAVEEISKPTTNASAVPSDAPMTG